jgi:hypothetical protein
MEEIRTRRRLSAEKLAISNRNYRRARERALVKLSHLYPDTYKQLLADERKADEETGKKWLDIGGVSLVSNSSNRNTDGSLTHTRPDQTNSDSKTQGDYEGEA